MPTLEWIGKEKVINHHQEVPFRVLNKKYTFNAEESENMIIRGDNLEALKALLPHYEGKIKCIYIDPPYNTGNEGWVYNDNVNDPKIKKWLGEVVGKEGEDLSRHDKWLCMMYPRLKLLQKLLSHDGAIFISIDDAEYANLKSVCDEIFGANCFVSNISWQLTYATRNDSKGIVNEVEHIIVYSKQPSWNPNKLSRTETMDSRYTNPDNDEKPWKAGDASAPGASTHTGMVYAIQHPLTGKLLYPPNGRCWTYGQEQMFAIMQEWADYELRELDDYDKRVGICGHDANVPSSIFAIMLSKPLDETLLVSRPRFDRGAWPILYFTSKGNGGIACKRYLNDMGGRIVTNLWPYTEVGHTDEAKKEMLAVFDGRATFDTPKPSRLIERILQIAGDEETLILDSFAGSGTTAHAVLNMNKADGGKRKFILIEMMDYAERITAERIKRVIDGYTYSVDEEELVYDIELTPNNLENGYKVLKDAKEAAKAAKANFDRVSAPRICNNHLQVIGIIKSNHEIEGTGGDFSFYDLGDALLMPDGNINEAIGTDRIREYVFYMETKKPVLQQPSNDNPFFLERNDKTDYYFYYEKDRVTTLDYEFLYTVHSAAESYIVYADQCALSGDELKKHNIVFKKIPRDIAKL